MDLSYFTEKPMHTLSPMTALDRLRGKKKSKEFLHFFTKYPLWFYTHYWLPPFPFYFLNYSWQLPFFYILFYNIFLTITTSPIPSHCWKLPMSPPTNFLYFLNLQNHLLLYYWSYPPLLLSYTTLRFSPFFMHTNFPWSEKG